MDNKGIKFVDDILNSQDYSQLESSPKYIDLLSKKRDLTTKVYVLLDEIFLNRNSSEKIKSIEIAKTAIEKQIEKINQEIKELNEPLQRKALSKIFKDFMKE